MLFLFCSAEMSTSSTIKINVTSPRTTKTTRPVWGVLTQPTDSEERLADFEERYREYVPASFVRWLESGGARVIAIQLRPQCTATTLIAVCDSSDNFFLSFFHSYDTDEVELRHLFESINGLLLTGGEILDVAYAHCACVRVLRVRVLRVRVCVCVSC